MQAIQLDLFTGKLVPSTSPVIHEKEDVRTLKQAAAIKL